VTLLLVVAMRLVMFWAQKIAERFFGRHEPWSQISLRPQSAAKLVGQRRSCSSPW